jgi:hypothetical protein
MIRRHWLFSDADERHLLPPASAITADYGFRHAFRCRQLSPLATPLAFIVLLI